MGKLSIFFHGDRADMFEASSFPSEVLNQQLCQVESSISEKMMPPGTVLHDTTTKERVKLPTTSEI